MEHHGNPSLPTFKHHFRAPGSPAQGPIRYAVGQTVLGMALIGRSQAGICAILLGDDAQALRGQLAEAFPGIGLAGRPGRPCRASLAIAVAFIDKDAAEGVIDLDIGGTPFEQKVWQALCGIPAGQTRSYGEVARHLGVPEAVRAAAGGLRGQPAGRGHPLPSCRARRRRPRRLSPGQSRAQRALLAEEQVR